MELIFLATFLRQGPKSITLKTVPAPHTPFNAMLRRHSVIAHSRASSTSDRAKLEVDKTLATREIEAEPSVPAVNAVDGAEESERKLSYEAILLCTSSRF